MNGLRDPGLASQRTLFALFAVSGFCGLIYESIWAHYLKLFVGHAAYAQTVVLVVFIGGMAIGAWLAGRRAERTRNPLAAYAIIEAIVGLFAISFQFIFTHTTDWAYASLIPALCSADGVCLPQWILAGLLILPQSILLGTTFPLMSAGILRAFPFEPGRSLSMLYFTNSIGAVFGVLASTFVLIPAMGLPGTTQAAGVMNLVLAAVVGLVSRFVASGHAGFGSSTSSRDLTAREPTATPPREAFALTPLLLIAGLTGLSSFIYEIVWIRMLGLVLGSSTHAFELMLSSFILGLALGGLWIKSRIDKIVDTMRFLATVQVVMGVLALLTLPIYNWMFDLMAWFLSAMSRTSEGYVLYNLASKLIAMVIMFPATFMAGMTLPLITYRLIRSVHGEKSIGYVYASNTAGAIVGVMVTVHLLMPQLGLKGTLIAGALVDVVLGWVLFALYRAPRVQGVPPRVRSDSSYRWGWSIAGLLVAAIVGMFAELDPMRLASGVYRQGAARLDDRYQVLFHRDGKTATIDVLHSESPSHVFIRTNGKTDAAIELDRDSLPSIDEVTMTMTAALPLAVRPDAKTAAVIGFGSGITTHTLLASPNLQRVDTIEIEAAMVEGARYFLPRNALAYNDPRSRIVIDDAKAFFARSNAKYDIIVSEPSNPWVSGVASLFSQEFYERVRHYLTSDGVLVQWIQIYEIEPDQVAAIIRALAKHFPNYEIYAADRGNLLLVASQSNAPLELSAKIFEMPALKADLFRLAIGHLGDLVPRRVAGSRIFGPWLMDGMVNSDFYPVVDLFAARSRFMGSTASGLIQPRGDNIPVLELLENRIWDTPLPPTPMRKGAWGYLHEYALAGEEIVDYLLAVPGSEQRYDWLDSTNAAQLHLVKGMLFRCEAFSEGEMLSEALRDELVGVANRILGAMSSQRQKRLWDAALASPCVTRMSAIDRNWLRLIERTGARDAAAMAKLGSQMIADKTATTERQWGYLVTATAAAQLATGDRMAARRTIDDNWLNLNQPMRDWPTMEMMLRLTLVP